MTETRLRHTERGLQGSIWNRQCGSQGKSRKLLLEKLTINTFGPRTRNEMLLERKLSSEAKCTTDEEGKWATESAAKRVEQWLRCGAERLHRKQPSPGTLTKGFFYAMPSSSRQSSSSIIKETNQAWNQLFSKVRLLLMHSLPLPGLPQDCSLQPTPVLKNKHFY